MYCGVKASWAWLLHGHLDEKRLFDSLASTLATWPCLSGRLAPAVPPIDAAGRTRLAIELVNAGALITSVEIAAPLPETWAQALALPNGENDYPGLLRPALPRLPGFRGETGFCSSGVGFDPIFGSSISSLPLLECVKIDFTSPVGVGHTLLQLIANHGVVDGCVAKVCARTPCRDLAPPRATNACPGDGLFVQFAHAWSARYIEDTAALARLPPPTVDRSYIDELLCGGPEVLPIKPAGWSLADIVHRLWAPVALSPLGLLGPPPSLFVRARNFICAVTDPSSGLAPELYSVDDPSNVMATPLFFSCARIDRLKAAATATFLSEPSAPVPSSFDVLCAACWRAVAASRVHRGWANRSKDAPVQQLFFTVDMRPRLEGAPPTGLPPGYVGNAFFVAAANAPLAELVAPGRAAFVAVVARVRAAKRAMLSGFDAEARFYRTATMADGRCDVQLTFVAGGIFISDQRFAENPPSDACFGLPLAGFSPLLCSTVAGLGMIHHAQVGGPQNGLVVYINIPADERESVMRFIASEANEKYG